jgi:heat shock protein HtpX
MKPIAHYAIKAPNWRGQLRLNQKRTFEAVVVFLLFYLMIGLLLDITFYWPHHLQFQKKWVDVYPNVANSPFLATGVALLHGDVLPLITMGLFLFSSFSLISMRLFAGRVMLLGTKRVEVTAMSTDPEEKQLYHVMEELKIASGMAFMPRIYIIEANYMNAFASGWSDSSALVAITRGLMQKLNRAQLQGVMAHELSHIKHRDTKLMLTVATLCNSMLIVIDVLFRWVIYSRRRREGGRFALIVILVRLLLPLINLFFLAYLSRTREYLADQGAVSMLRDNTPLAEALMIIEKDYQAHHQEYQAVVDETPHEGLRRESYLFDPAAAGVKNLFSMQEFFSTHPKMNKRLQALGYTRQQVPQEEKASGDGDPAS